MIENNILVFKNELKNKIVSKYKLIGISSEVILSFEIFKKNTDLEEFIQDIFSFEFRPYVFKSRTLLVSRVIRIIENGSSTDVSKYKSNLYRFLEGLSLDAK